MRVGFIGLGIMGLPMATNIAKRFPLVGFDIKEVTAPFEVVHSYEELVYQSDVIVSMVPKNEHVLSLFESIRGFLKEGQIWIDMSTIAPSVSRKVAAEVKALGVRFYDCPVVKSQPAAVAGTLGIYIGGDEKTYAEVLPILSCMGSNIIYMGDNGAGLTMKILHNMLVGEIQNGVNEIFAMAKRCKMNLQDVATAISYGGGQCFYLDTKFNNINKGEFPTAFSVSNMNKDVHLAEDLMEELGMDLPGVKNVNRVYEKAMADDFASEDFSATFKVVEKGE